MKTVMLNFRDAKKVKPKKENALKGEYPDCVTCLAVFVNDKNKIYETQTIQYILSKRKFAEQIFLDVHDIRFWIPLSEFQDALLGSNKEDTADEG